MTHSPSPPLAVTPPCHRIADAIPHPVWIAGPDGIPTYFNRRWVEAAGGPPADPAAGWLDAIDPADRAAMARWAQFLRTGTPPPVECRLVRPDGTPRRHAVHAGAVHAENDRHDGWVVTFTDVHGQPAAQSSDTQIDTGTTRSDVGPDAAREREFLRAVLDNLSTGVVVCDGTGRPVLVNQRARDVVGAVDGEAGGGESWADRPALFAADGQTPLAADTDPLTRVVRDGWVPDTVVVALNRGGSRRTYLVTGQAFTAADGSPFGAVVEYADVTDRRRAEATLRDRETLLRGVIATIPCAVFWKDRASIYLGCNEQAARDLELMAPGEAVGRTDYEFAAARDRAEETRAAERAVIASGEPQLHAEETRTLPDGQTAYHLTSRVPLRDAAAAVVGVLTVRQDVTELKRLEAQFVQSQKLEAVGRLAGGIAHDFNNLLTVINGYTDVLMASFPESDPSHRFLTEIMTAGQRAAVLTRQLLAFGRKQFMVRTPVDFATVLTGLDTTYDPEARAGGVRVTVSCAPDLRRVTGDRGQLEQVVTHLVSNARDAMREGGVVTVDAVNVPAGNRKGEPKAFGDPGPGPYVALTVTDTGRGMTDAVRARIFEPFFTTKPAGEGTGLGLATVYGIVKAHGGYGQIETAVGRGTTFRVFLPAGDLPAGGPVAPAGSTAGGPLFGTETVLVVDDEPGVMGLNVHTLRQCGYKVLTAADGAEAIDVARRHPSRIDLLLTDLTMPGLCGREVADRLTLDRPDLRVLFQSGYSDDSVLRSGIAADRVSFLEKPYSPAVLARKVREVLDASGRPAPSRAGRRGSGIMAAGGSRAEEVVS